MIIVDPISAYMGGSDGNGNVETREVLFLLQAKDNLGKKCKGLTFRL
ncbi:hypothetical protein [Bradyrhizobium sp. B117]